MIHGTRIPPGSPDAGHSRGRIGCGGPTRRRTSRSAGQPVHPTGTPTKLGNPPTERSGNRAQPRPLDARGTGVTPPVSRTRTIREGEPRTNPSMALGASTDLHSSSSQIPKAAGIPPWDSTMARGRGRVRSSDSQPADPNSTRAQVHETGECEEAEHVHDTPPKTTRPPPNFSGSGGRPDTRVKGGEPEKRQAGPKQETSRARDGVGGGARPQAACADPSI